LHQNQRIVKKGRKKHSKNDQKGLSSPEKKHSLTAEKTGESSFKKEEKNGTGKTMGKREWGPVTTEKEEPEELQERGTEPA